MPKEPPAREPTLHLCLLEVGKRLSQMGPAWTLLRRVELNGIKGCTDLVGTAIPAE